MSAGERFVLPISTGCAAHVSLEKALLGGLCEVIERDAISLTWLQQLALPRLELDALPSWADEYVARNERHQHDVETLFFDATTELGVPTIYALQIAPHNEAVATLVMCSTELDPAVAVTKIMRESASSRTSLQRPQACPESWDDFLDVFHGATFMGRRAQLPAFDFLRHSPRRRQLSDLPVLTTGDERQDLANLLARLQAHEMEAFAVDLTTDEARRAGMWVVRTIIPALQPLSFSYRARFLGHPRLYDAPRLLGYPVRSEAEINPWPQPFA
jgi:ribosomal protein S12 methylthiotransferase accessory factor